VHRAVVLAVWVGLLGGAAGARADWEVRRSGPAPLREHAIRELLARPDDSGLAARVVKLSSKAELAATLERLRASAASPTASYGALAAFAQVLLAAGRAGEAAEAFGRALQARPSAAPALGRARALALARRPEEALAAYVEALAHERRPAQRRPLLEAVVALAVRTSAPEQELWARGELYALSPGDPRRALDLARTLARAGRPEEGATLLETLLRQADRRLATARRNELVREAAHLREAAGDDEAAENLLHEILGVFATSAGGPGSPRGSNGPQTAQGGPEFPAKRDGHASRLPGTAPVSEFERLELYRHLIRIARRRETVSDLQGRLERAVSVPGRGRLPEWQALAEIREDLGDYEGALQAWKRASELDPHSMALRGKVLLLQGRLGQEDELARTYEELARRAPEDVQLLLDLVDRKFRRGEKEEARRRFDQAFRTFRRRPDALAKLADLASRWGEDDRVLACWDAVLTVAPRDERAIVGLGEAHFQRGRRELARRTWQGMLLAIRPPAEGHARLAELLGDHELVDEAIAEARAAQRLDPHNPSHHRTLARILEKKRDLSGAISEWRAALQKSTGPARAGERREARSRIVNLLGREGRERLRAEAVLLKDRWSRHPEDRETAIYLAELQLRLQEPTDAISTLEMTARKLPGDAEVVLMLVRLLRQSRQTQKAVEWLERLAQEMPTRAQDALLQVAEIHFQQYRDGPALHAADRAAAADDSAEVLLRVADVQERAGRLELALGSYRRALGREVSARAALGVARLLVRRGDLEEASRMLRAAARQAPDAEMRAELLEQEIELAELLGDLAGLLRSLGTLSHESPSERRLYAELLRRALTMTNADGDGDVAAARALARRGLRPLLDLVTDPQGDPDAATVELLGFLGNRDATPVLNRIAQGGSQRARAGASQAAPGATSASVAAVIALGRLRDPRGRSTLEGLAEAPDANLRAAAIWALGRLASPEAAATLEQATRDPRPEIAALAHLGIGRLREAHVVDLLLRTALDLSRPVDVRRAAVLGLALAESQEAASALLPLLDADLPLARAAAAAVGVLRDRRTLAELWRHALLGDEARAGLALGALRLFAGNDGLPEEAGTIRQNRIDVRDILDALSALPPALVPAQAEVGPGIAPDLEALWIEHASDIEHLLRRALEGPPADRARALAALDSREGGPGLGVLVDAAATPSPQGEQMLRALAERMADRVIASLDHSDITVRLRALRVASKLGDERLSLVHVLASLATDPVEGARSPFSELQGESVAIQVAQAQMEAGRLNPEALVKALRPWLEESAWQRRLAAIRMLRIVAGAARPLLEKGLEDPSAFVRAEAAAALGELPEALGPLIRASRDVSSAVRAAVARGLARRSERAAQEVLGRLAHDEVPSVRTVAEQALRRPGAPR
jgi:tetratricopeptide (TPR) repeat protein